MYVTSFDHRKTHHGLIKWLQPPGQIARALDIKTSRWRDWRAINPKYWLLLSEIIAGYGPIPVRNKTNPYVMGHVHTYAYNPLKVLSFLARTWPNTVHGPDLNVVTNNEYKELYSVYRKRAYQIRKLNSTGRPYHVGSVYEILHHPAGNTGGSSPSLSGDSSGLPEVGGHEEDSEKDLPQV